jgi:hypothetical protein
LLEGLGDVSTVDFGPFAPATEERKWSQTNIVEPPWL